MKLHYPQTTVEWILYTIAAICTVSVIVVIIGYTFYKIGA